MIYIPYAMKGKHNPHINVIVALYAVADRPKRVKKKRGEPDSGATKWGTPKNILSFLSLKDLQEKIKSKTGL